MRAADVDSRLEMSRRAEGQPRSGAQAVVDRLVCLDGLRGLAALAVVLCHLAAAFAPAVVFGSGSPSHSRYDLTLESRPFLDLPFQGDFSVCLFFVLSGIALSRAPLGRGGRRAAWSGLLRRYPRLMIPALVVTMLAALLMAVPLFDSNQASKISGSAWLRSFWSSSPDAWEAFREATWGVFAHAHQVPTYVPVLWTLHYELVGSGLVLGLLLLRPPGRWRALIYLVAALWLWQSYLFCFVAGMVLSELQINSAGWRRPAWQPVLAVVGGYGLLLGSFPYPSPSTPGFYVQLLPGTWAHPQQQAHVVGATFVLLAVLGLPAVQRLLIGRYLLLLGRISFGLYLVHFVVLRSLGTLAFTTLIGVLPYGLAVAATSLVVLVVSLLAAFVLTALVDEPVVRLTKTAYARCEQQVRRQFGGQLARDAGR